MRRVISLWLPTYATDRLRRLPDAPPDEAPLVTVVRDGARRLIATADGTAAMLGLKPGLKLAQAQAMVDGLVVREADPAAEAEGLRKLAGWCLRYAPLVAPDLPDGVFIDVTGSTHLHGGETALLRDLVSRLLAQGFAARAAIAETPGAAWAVARYGGQDLAVVPPGAVAEALAALPIEALRLGGGVVDGLRLVGLDRISRLTAMPRGPLVRRFGRDVALRLDQALGRVAAPITPWFPPEVPLARMAFAEPLLTPEAFSAVIARLVGDLCERLEKAGQGARRLDLVFERVDGSVQVLRIGTAKPSRDARHLARMLDERLERLDPGLGVEAMRLLAPVTDALAYVQAPVPLTEADAVPVDLAPLVDRLGNRLGAGRVYGAAPVESDVPERSVRRVAPVVVEKGPRLRRAPSPPPWPSALPRPVRLLDPPQPVEVMALLPDAPPVAFTWRRVRHRVRHADGPERIAGEWWRRDGETHAVRDYFRVEDEEGRRYWLFRRGDGVDGETGDLRWFLHGFF
jgi:protein ImuB